jgi:hypothetical protein
MAAGDTNPSAWFACSSSTPRPCRLLTYPEEPERGAHLNLNAPVAVSDTDGAGVVSPAPRWWVS